MEIKIDRESLLKPLQLIIGVVERRQTLPILGNLLLKLVNDQLSIIATDLEIEIVTHLLIPVSKNGEITLPARKFMDICKALPDEAQITIKTEGERITIRSGKSRFTLSTLPASEFPNIDNFDSILEFTIPQRVISRRPITTLFPAIQYEL